MRDRHVPNEHHEMELSRVWAVSKLDNSETAGENNSQNFFLEILFLIETRNCRNVLVDLQVWLGIDNVFTIDPVRLSGGLAFLEKKNIKIIVKFADKNIVDCLVQFGEFAFSLSCVYGEPSEGCEVVWERISRWGCFIK